MLRKLLGALIIALIGFNLYAAEDQASGAIENIHYNKENYQLKITGKAWDRIHNEAATNFRITINGIEPKSYRKLGADFPEVFTIIAHFEHPIKNGLSELNIVARFPSGRELELRNIDGSPTFIHQPAIYTRHWILLAIILIFALASSATLFRIQAGTIDFWIKQQQKKIAAGIFIVFFILVAAGITGSSIRILFGGPFGNAVADVTGSNSRLFKLRPDRGDEWGVLTPNALAQIHHTPKFPVINTNIGLDGQNMGIIGMTGVPIKQWASLARPATWGYFFLPLRQALAWQWQLPFWGCLLALWWLLGHWKPHQSGRNLALAFLFCISPYAAAWSNWPLYAAFFPAMVLGILISLTKTESLTAGIFLGLALGYFIAAWILILYPPWIISLGTLIFLLYFGWQLDNRRYVHLKIIQVAGLIAALIICGLLIGSWWQDTRGAIALIQNTVYPGQRTAITGGDNSFLWIFRGYTNLETLTFGTGPWTNQPEISSYLWFPLVMIWLCVLGLFGDHQNRWTIAGLTIFMAFYAWFVFLGIPLWLAKLSQWGRVPTNRGDVSLGLAFVFLLSLLSKDWIGKPSPSKPLQLINFLIVFGSSILVYAHLTAMPIYVFPKNSPVYIIALLALSLCCVWWLLRGETGRAIGLLLIAYVASTLGFNPISKAPREIKISSETKELASDATGGIPRTLVIGGEGIGPLSLASIGIPIVNGVLYYPHRTLWDQLGLEEKHWAVVNRYQHLGFISSNHAAAEAYNVNSPVMDQVLVTINPRSFDFSRSGASRVAALEEQAVHLRSSPMLKEIGSHRGLVWFLVKTKKDHELP